MPPAPQSRNAIPRRRFHRFHLELVAVVVIALVEIIDFRAALQAPAQPRRYTPMTLSLVEETAAVPVPRTVTPLSLESPDGPVMLTAPDEPDYESPLLFAFGTASSPLTVPLPAAQPLPPDAITLAVAHRYEFPEPPLQLPEIHPPRLPHLDTRRGPSPAAPLFSEPRPVPALATPLPQKTAVPDFVPVPVSAETAPVPASTNRNDAATPVPFQVDSPISARAYLSYVGMGTLPIIVLDAPDLTPAERLTREGELLREYPGDGTTQTLYYAESRGAGGERGTPAGTAGRGGEAATSAVRRTSGGGSPPTGLGR